MIKFYLWPAVNSVFGKIKITFPEFLGLVPPLFHLVLIDQPLKTGRQQWQWELKSALHKYFFKQRSNAGHPSLAIQSSFSGNSIIKAEIYWSTLRFIFVQAVPFCLGFILGSSYWDDKSCFSFYTSQNTCPFEDFISTLCEISTFWDFGLRLSKVTVMFWHKLSPNCDEWMFLTLRQWGVVQVKKEKKKKEVGWKQYRREILKHHNFYWNQFSWTKTGKVRPLAPDKAMAEV